MKNPQIREIEMKIERLTLQLEHLKAMEEIKTKHGKELEELRRVEREDD